MRMLAKFLVLLAFLFSHVAEAWNVHGAANGTSPVVINNYNPTQVATTNATQVTHHDDTGNAIDAHAGSLLYVNNKFYLYGESDGCGYRPGIVGLWCGIKVYSNNTLQSDKWHYEGFLFDGTTATWQTNCGTSTSFGGCYSPKMLYNAANNNYVLWLSGFTGGSDVLYVLKCTTPTGGATPTVPGTNCVQQPNATVPTAGNESPSFLVDVAGNGYATWTDIANVSYHVYVIALTSDFTNTTGPATNTGMVGEGQFIFQRGGLTYVVTGTEFCAYCDTANSFYVSASSPLGTYSAVTTINGSGSCQGQARDGTVFSINGSTTYLYMVDQWWSQVSTSRSNQGFANIYFQPLSFTGSAINAFTCNPTVTINGMAETSPAPSPGAPDQTDYSDVFIDWCDITSSTFRMQTFVPTRSTVASISLPLGKNNASCQVALSPCADPNGSITISLVTLDGSNNPVTTLASSTIAASSLLWATKWTNVAINQTVTPGTSYGIELSSTGTVGCFGTSLNNAGTIPYANGVERVSTNGGSTWATEAGKSLMFSTY